MTDPQYEGSFTDANGQNVKGGDRVQYQFGHRFARLGNVYHDGDADVVFEDTGLGDTVKFVRLCKVPEPQSAQTTVGAVPVSWSEVEAVLSPAKPVETIARRFLTHVGVSDPDHVYRDELAELFRQYGDRRAAFVNSGPEPTEAERLIREWEGKLPGLAARWIEYHENYIISDSDDADFIRAFGPKTIAMLFAEIRAANAVRSPAPQLEMALYELGRNEAVLFNPGRRFHGWAFRKHADGYYVSHGRLPIIPEPWGPEMLTTPTKAADTSSPAPATDALLEQAEKALEEISNGPLSSYEVLGLTVTRMMGRASAVLTALRRRKA